MNSNMAIAVAALLLWGACCAPSARGETQHLTPQETRVALERGDIASVQSALQAAVHAGFSRLEAEQHRDELGYRFWKRVIGEQGKVGSLARRFLEHSTGQRRGLHEELSIAIAAVNFNATTLAANRLEEILSVPMSREQARAYRDRAGYEVWRRALEQGGRLAAVARTFLRAAE